MRAGSVVGIVGHMGAGKGLTLQMYAAAFRRAGLHVFANYDSKLATRRLENIPELVECHDGAVFWDEIDLNLHAREFALELSIKIVKWIKLIRKKRLRLVWATQNPYFVDISIRRVTHYLINCVLIPTKPLATRLDVYSVESGGEMFIYRRSFRFQHSQWLYGSYDTFDERNILSPEIGGTARAPLEPDDFVHRQYDNRQQLQKEYKKLQKEHAALVEVLEQYKASLSSPLAAPSSEAGAAKTGVNGRRSLSDLRR